MFMSIYAQWLNNAFHGFDYAILSFYHLLAVKAGFILTPLMRLMTLIGEKGLVMFLLAAVLMCFSRTRKAGICIFGAVCCGALITNLWLKDFIARARPFETLQQYAQWWQAVASPAESGFSFPSGHTTAAMAGITALALTSRKKGAYLGFIYVVLIAISRNYLMAHYPSDVIAAVIIGGLSAVISYFITKVIYYVLERYRDIPLFKFILEFNIIKRAS